MKRLDPEERALRRLARDMAPPARQPRRRPVCTKLADRAEWTTTRKKRILWAASRVRLASGRGPWFETLIPTIIAGGHTPNEAVQDVRTRLIAYLEFFDCTADELEALGVRLEDIPPTVPD